MPMNTTFVRRRPRSARRRAAARTWSTISAVREVAGEAQLAGRAERAANRAAGLARDADGVALALLAVGRSAGGIVHQDATRSARRPPAGGAPSRSGRRRSTRISVSARVSREKAASTLGRAGRPAGSGSTAALSGSAGPQAVVQLAGPEAPAGRARPNQAASGIGGNAGQAGPKIGGHPPDYRPTGGPTDVPANPGRPRRSSAPRHRPAAGRLDPSRPSAPSAVARRQAGADRHTSVPGPAVESSGATDARQHDEPAGARSRR